MNKQVTLCSMAAIVLISSPVIAETSACGAFNFEEPDISDGVIIVKEKERINSTFTVRDKNCSMVYSDISISKYEKATKFFVRQCRIHRASVERPPYDNMSCYCLETPGFCRFTFIAEREHNAIWKFFTGNRDIKDAFVTFNITHPPRVMHLEVVGYDSYIPKHKFVTVVCSWENGNPPSTIRLMDRHNTVLEKGDRTGNISYTFSPIECFHAGVIRCEADRSDRNASITMLIECPPELVRNPSSIMKLTMGQNADMAFPFRSPTSYIKSCHINQMIQIINVDTKMLQTVVMNCKQAVENVSIFDQGHKHCLYSVTGEPPDLRLNIHVRNLMREDSGLWHVTISNDEGSDDIYLQIFIELRDSKDSQTSINQGGTFNFEVPNIFDGVFVEKERERINLTFTVRDKNYSMVYSDILISKYDKATDDFIRQCKIHRASVERPPIDMSCYCLEIPGFCIFTFIADREHNAIWKFSTETGDIQDSFVTFNITYPPRVTHLEVVGYNSYIPKHKFVTVVCSWENGNPPSTIRLMDRQNTVLEKGDRTGNISYTFSPVECFHAGVIRCEADRSDRNTSITMLIECPPEFIRNTSSIMNVTIGQNADMSFPFRSPKSIINSCQINQMIQSRNGDTNMFQTVVMKCKMAVENVSIFHQENKDCFYSVTGEPPDLHLNIHVRNLRREDSGLWHVTISNDEGSAEIYLQAFIELRDSKDNQISTNQNDIIIGVSCCTLFILIIAFLVTKAKRVHDNAGVSSTRADQMFLQFIAMIMNKSIVTRRRKREKKDLKLNQPLGTDTVEHSPRLSVVYYEIPDSQLETESAFCLPHMPSATR